MEPTHMCCKCRKGDEIQYRMCPNKGGYYIRPLFGYGRRLASCFSENCGLGTNSGWDCGIGANIHDKFQHLASVSDCAMKSVAQSVAISDLGQAGGALAGARIANESNPNGPCECINLNDDEEAACLFTCYSTYGGFEMTNRSDVQLVGTGQLASGKYKRVFQGRRSGSQVAIAISKVNRPGAFKQVKTEYEQIKGSTCLQCPHVMQVYDGWKDWLSKQFVMITDFVQGKTGEAFVDAQDFSTMPLRKWVGFTRQMLETWQCLLSRGFQQHDVGEQNLMVTPDYGYTMIDLDFKPLKPGDLAFKAARVFQMALKVGGAKKECTGFPFSDRFICEEKCGGVFRQMSATFSGEDQALLQKQCAAMEETHVQQGTIPMVLESLANLET